MKIVNLVILITLVLSPFVYLPIISKKNGKTLFSNRLAKKNEKIKYNSILLNKSYLLIGSKQKKSVMIKYSNLNTLKKVNYNFDKYIFLKDFAYLISEKKIVKVQ